MKQEINYSRYVDRYLDGIMGESEKIWFEKELEDNSELQSELNLQKKINNIFIDREVMELQSQLDDIYEKTYHPWKSTVNISRFQIKPAYLVGSIVGSLVIVVLFLTLLGKSASSEALYAEYYKPAEINMNFRTAENIVDSELREAMIFYESREYKDAIVLFEKILKEDKTRIGLNLYSGISYMEINEYAEANKNFRKIIDHNANAFIESAQWYLGLCYVMTEENERAVEIFRKIANSDGYYKKDARRIMRKIK